MIQTSTHELILLMQTDFFLQGMAMSRQGHEMGEFAGPVNAVMSFAGEALIQIGPCYHRVTSDWMKHSQGKVLGALETHDVTDVMRDSYGGISFWVGNRQYWLYPKNHPEGEKLWDTIAGNLLYPTMDIDDYGGSDRDPAYLDPRVFGEDFPCGD